MREGGLVAHLDALGARVVAAVPSSRSLRVWNQFSKGFFLPKLEPKACLAPSLPVFQLGFYSLASGGLKIEVVEKESELLFQREGKEGILCSLEQGRGEIPAEDNPDTGYSQRD